MTEQVSGRGFRFGVITSRTRGGATWPDIVREVVELGYQCLSMTDHLDGQLAPGPALGVAATLQPGLRVGSLVYCNDLYRPRVLAREAASLHRLSSGRFEFGVGAGWDPRDYQRAGLEMNAPGERIDRLCSAVATFRRYFADELGAGAGPPVLIGGGGRRLLRAAGELADIVSLNPRMPPGGSDAKAVFGWPNDGVGTGDKLKYLAEGAGARLDSIELAATLYAVVVSDDRDSAAGFLARNAGIDREEVLSSPHVLVGTVNQMADTLQRRRDQWGMSYVTVTHRYRRALAPVLARLRDD